MAKINAYSVLLGLLKLVTAIVSLGLIKIPTPEVPAKQYPNDPEEEGDYHPHATSPDTSRGVSPRRRWPQKANTGGKLTPGDNGDTGGKLTPGEDGDPGVVPGP